MKLFKDFRRDIEEKDLEALKYLVARLEFDKPVVWRGKNVRALQFYELFNELLRATQEVSESDGTVEENYERYRNEVDGRNELIADRYEDASNEEEEPRVPIDWSLIDIKRARSDFERDFLKNNWGKDSKRLSFKQYKILVSMYKRLTGGREVYVEDKYDLD